MTLQEAKEHIKEDKKRTDILFEKQLIQLKETVFSPASHSAIVNHLTELETRSDTLYWVLKLISEAEKKNEK